MEFGTKTVSYLSPVLNILPIAGVVNGKDFVVCLKLYPKAGQKGFHASIDVALLPKSGFVQENSNHHYYECKY